VIFIDWPPSICALSAHPNSAIFLGMKNPTDKPGTGQLNRKPVFRVLSYNVHGCIGAGGKVDTQRTARVIAESDADLVALQEVDFETANGGGRSQAEAIGKRLKMETIYFPVEESGRHRYGLAVLSRLPLANVQFLRLPNLYPRFNPRRRGAILTTLETSYGPVRWINVHLSVFRVERRRQLPALLAECGSLATHAVQPVILCGDLNAGPGSHTYRVLGKHMTDTQQASSGDELRKGTFHARSPAFRIDHIFVSSPFTVLRAEVRNSPLAAAASDHLPVFAEVVLNVSPRHRPS
jgi:endonuclease/exonuclease/phosphatase family metal-dependent hydrolase